MSKLTKSYKTHLFERLQTPEEVAGYLNAALEEEDLAVLLLALRDVAEARGIAKVAADANLNRENVYRILSDQGNPRMSSLCALLRAMGIELQAKASKGCSRTQAAVACATVAPTLSKTQGDRMEPFHPALERDRRNDYESTDFHASDEPLAA